MKPKFTKILKLKKKFKLCLKKKKLRLTKKNQRPVRAKTENKCCM